MFLSMTLFVLLFVLEGLVAGQLTDQQTTLAAGLFAAFALMFGVAMILPVCFELAFANRPDGSPPLTVVSDGTVF